MDWIRIKRFCSGLIISILSTWTWIWVQTIKAGPEMDSWLVSSLVGLVFWIGVYLLGTTLCLIIVTRFNFSVGFLFYFVFAAGVFWLPVLVSELFPHSIATFSLEGMDQVLMAFQFGAIYLFEKNLEYSAKAAQGTMRREIH